MDRSLRASAFTKMARLIAGYTHRPWPSADPKGPAPSPSKYGSGPRTVGSTRISKPLERQIERRVYELWQQAGFPKGRDEEFAERAKQELLKEQKRKYMTRDAPP